MAINVLMCECDVRFTGENEVRFGKAPEVGVQGRCILFVQEPQAPQVGAILKKFGWELLGMKTQPVDAGMLEPLSMAPFRSHFEACLKDGHALVWYS